MKVKLKVPMCVGEYVAMNSVTGRAGQPLFLTVPTANPSKIGSEVMSKVQCPPGFQLVGFDFD